MIKNMAALLLLAPVLAMMLGTVYCQGNCGDNEVWSTCGSNCPKTCEDVTNMRSSKMCPQLCVKGCFCMQGYVLNDGRCVAEVTCPCKPHAHYMCGTGFPLTCDNYLNPPKGSTDICKLGCHCEKGYVRYGTSGRCVLPKECSN